MTLIGIMLVSATRCQSTKNVHFDPRPPFLRRRPEYPDEFRNMEISFATPQPNMPILQLYPPANPYAIDDDHRYFPMSHTESLLESLHITTISADVACDLEKKTRGQASNAKWYAERCYRLCSSNFGRICKATDRANFQKLSRDLTESKKIDTFTTRHGRSN